MRALRLCVRGAVLQYRALQPWVTPLGYLSSKLVAPVFQLVFFVELGTFAQGSSNALYFALGNAIHVTALSGILGVTFSIANQGKYGTLTELLASPGSRLAIFLGPAFIQLLDGIAGAVLGFVLASVLYGLDLSHANLLLLAASIVAVSFSTVCLGLCVGSLALIVRESLLVANLIYFALLFLCGINFPVTRLPAVVQHVSYALPMTRGVQVARLATLAGGGPDVASLLGQEVAVGVAYAIVGFGAFRLMEAINRAGGVGALAIHVGQRRAIRAARAAGPERGRP